MAWGAKGAFLVAGSKVSESSKAFTTVTTAVSVGNYALVIVASDNISTTDGDHSEVTGVSDSAGNTYGKLVEWTNSEGAAAGGATVSVWGVIASNALSVGGTVTVTWSSAITAKGVSGYVFTLGAGSTVSIAGSTQHVSDTAIDPSSLTISGLTSKEYLFIRGTASEAPTTAGTWTSTTSYTATGTGGTSGGSGIANMCSNGEFRILTATGDTSDPTFVADDHANVYFALLETVAAAPTAHFLTCLGCGQ